MTETTTDYEREAAATRERIAATIDDLQARLSPKALFDSAVESVGTAGRNAVAEVKTTAASHPLALGVIGLIAGVGLLARSRINRATVEYGDSYAAYADYDDGYAANLAADDEPVGRARQRLDALQHEAHHVVDDNPLAVIAVGLATGLLIGAVVPVSAIEHELFHGARTRVGAALDAGVIAVKHELQPARFSLAGGTSGLTEQLSASLATILAEAGRALTTKPVTGH